MSISYQYYDEVKVRLRDNFEYSRRMNLMGVLMEISRHLKWESFECALNANELAAEVGIAETKMSGVLKDLENIGAIFRVKQGRAKLICLNPEGAYRGNVMHHGQAVERFGLKVYEGGKGKQPDATAPETTVNCSDIPPKKENELSD